MSDRKAQTLCDIFRSRFILLRGDRTQAKFADDLGTARQTIQRWEGDYKRIPMADNLVMIAEKCNVSVDWLLGLTDKKERG